MCMPEGVNVKLQAPFPIKKIINKGMTMGHSEKHHTLSLPSTNGLGLSVLTFLLAVMFHAYLNPK